MTDHNRIFSPNPGRTADEQIIYRLRREAAQREDNIKREAAQREDNIKREAAQQMENEKKAIAKSMKETNIAPDLIAHCTGLSLEQINML